jgi:protein involved in polysaccharide export with SLBB domain
MDEAIRAMRLHMVRTLQRNWQERWAVVHGLLLMACLAIGPEILAQISPSAMTAAQPAAAVPAMATTGGRTGAPTLRLAAGDLVEITTFDTPELSGKFRVDSRGEI